MRTIHYKNGTRLLAVVCVFTLLSGVLMMTPRTSPVAAQAEPTPLPLFALPDARTNVAFTSNTIAFNDINRLLMVANALSDTVSVVAPVSGELRNQIEVGNDPRSVAVTTDGGRALIANRGDATLSVYDFQLDSVVDTIELGGRWAYGVVTSGNEIAYVSLQGSNEVVVVDLINREVTDRITTPALPTGLALWGDFLYVTHMWSGEVSLIYLPQLRVVDTIATGAGMTPTMAIDITRGLAYLPQTRSYSTNPAATYDTRVFPVVNVLALNGFNIENRAHIPLNTADRPVNTPFAAEVDPFRRWVYVANAGSNDVSVIEIESGRALANIEVGANPRGLLLNNNNTQLFIHNTIDGTLAVVDTATFDTIDTIPIDTQFTLSADVLIGAELFHNASDARLAEDRWISCANCHLDGLADGQTWHDFPGGARNTPLLFDLDQTAPYNWSGNYDELADVELKIREVQAGTGFIPDGVLTSPDGDPHAGLSPDLDAITIYLQTLEGTTSPIRGDAALVARGETVYVEQECNTCHVLPVGTNQQAYNVGTGGTFDTPTVNWLWLSAPYYHDGSAATLADVFRLPGAHQLQGQVPPDDIDALIAYLLTLPSDESLTD
ncbi:MAG: hypothetical protein AAFR56_02340 [Chloroflexota bacterium]